MGDKEVDRNQHVKGTGRYESTLSYWYIAECTLLSGHACVVTRPRVLELLEVPAAIVKDLNLAFGTSFNSVDEIRELSIRDAVGSDFRWLPTPPDLLSSLRTLNIVSTPLCSLPPKLGGLSSLRALVVEGNMNLASLPSELGKLSGMQALTLARNLVLASLPPELGALSSLQMLAIRACVILRSLPPELGRLSSLQTLTISSNPILQMLPAELGRLSSLRELVIVGNRGLKSLPAELAGRLSSLRERRATLS